VYFEREESRLKLPPELNNCPVECPNLPRYYDQNRRNFCDNCPHKLERDNLKAAAEDLIFAMLGTSDTRYGFEKMLSAFHQTAALKDLPREEMTVKTGEMVMVYQSEKSRADAIREVDKPE
jgi:hypothetical protein